MRVINFSAGPAALPLPALERAQAELLDYQGSGMSIMEQSHRGPVYERVHHEAIERLTRLLQLPKTHQILFIPSAAHLHFAMVPMNFLRPSACADYVVTGTWGEKAIEEALLCGEAREACSTRNPDGTYTRVPAQSELTLDPRAPYAHTTSNNTIFGTQFDTLPDTGSVPHICDMSSDFLWRPTDMSRFALVYAGAQKNIGPSGITVVVAHREFMATARTDIPKVMRYQTHAEANSLYHTPNTWGVYLVRNVAQWLEEFGGLPAMEQRNRAKATALYGCIDRLSGFYRAPVEKQSRSVMNVVFRLPTESLEDRFVSEAKQAGMVGLKGHRSVGGIRVSAYNAVGLEDVTTLVSFMERFAQHHG